MLQSPVKEQINSGILKGLEDVKERRWLILLKNSMGNFQIYFFQI